MGARYSIAEFNAIPVGTAEPAAPAVPTETAAQLTGRFSLEDFEVLPEVTLSKEARRRLSEDIAASMPYGLVDFIIRKVADAVAKGTGPGTVDVLAAHVRDRNPDVFRDIEDAIEEMLHNGIDLKGTTELD